MAKLPFDLQIEDIEKIADILEEKKLSKVLLADDEAGFRIEICAKEMPPMPPMPPMNAPMSMAQMPAVVPAAPTPAAAVEAAPAKVEGNAVKSPIVGTYYERPAPDKAPFVTVGSTVKQGDVVMIIESMKLMNEVRSDFDGVVKEILVKNGDAVEFDQPIMIIG